MDRRAFLNQAGKGALTGSVVGGVLACQSASAQGGGGAAPRRAKGRPNILFAISDDQSWVHTGATGDPVVKTPAFDRVAEEGVLFTHAFCSSPSCTPSRGAVLTGQDFWRLDEGGNLWSTLSAEFPVYPDLLAEGGYHVGHIRKGWGPGSVEPGGRQVNAAGRQFKSFPDFLAASPPDRPFCFWFGSTDPHRPYEAGSGVASGKMIEDVCVPPFLADAPEVRSDILDYFVETERYDRDVGEMMALLEANGQLDNTIVVVTSDNGMPFPRAKANLYDYGTRMPLAIRWPAAAPGGRVLDDFVSFADFAPTFLQAAGLTPPEEMTGRSLVGLLASGKAGRVEPERDSVITGRERHAWCRAGGLGYPIRALRTYDFLYIRNFLPDRWPAGDPPTFGDCDGGPTKAYMLENREREDITRLAELAFGKRPAEELYHLVEDPAQTDNVADEPEYAAEKGKLRADLERHLTERNDPRLIGGAEIWDACEYYGKKQSPGIR